MSASLDHLQRTRAPLFVPVTAATSLASLTVSLVAAAQVMGPAYSFMEMALPGPTQNLMVVAGSPIALFFSTCVISALIAILWRRGSPWASGLSYTCLAFVIFATLFALVAFSMPFLSIRQ